MKKILVVITTAFVKVGGLTSVMMNYYRSIDKTDIQIDFASTNTIEKDLEEELNKYNSNYYKLPKRSNTVKYLISLAKISKGYQVLHIHGNSATATIELLAGRMAKVPNRIIHIHTSHTDHPAINFLLRPLFHKLYTTPLACSEIAGNWIFNSGNFSVLKNAINVNKYNHDELIREKYRKELNLENNLVFGHIGKMMNAKNHIFLIDVFKELVKKNDKSKLVLVGDGELRRAIQEKVLKENMNDNVIFLGMRDDIPELLQAMDIFIFPSLWEGLPLSLLEAQSTGLPCFVSSSVSEEVKMSDYTYYLPLSLSAKDWANYILENIPTISRYAICEEVKENIIKKKYDINIVAKDLRDIYMT